MNKLAPNEKPLPRSGPAPRTSDLPVKCPIPPSMFASAALAAVTSWSSKPLSSKRNVSLNRLEKEREPAASHPDTAAEETNGRGAAASPVREGLLPPSRPAGLARTTKSTAKGACPVTFRRSAGSGGKQNPGLEQTYFWRAVSQWFEAGSRARPNRQGSVYTRLWRACKRALLSPGFV